MSEERAEYRAKVFKSGNSAALRLPKDMGLPEGTEVRIVREAPMTYRIEPVDAPKPKFNIEKVWGSARGSGLRYVENREFEPRPSERD